MNQEQKLRTYDMDLGPKDTLLGKETKKGTLVTSQEKV